MSDMKAALGSALHTFTAHPVVLVALDFDGTIAPIVSRPEDARATAANRRAIRQLAGLDGVTVAIVSGRPLEELRQLADPPADVRLVGSHGVQRGTTHVTLDGQQRDLLGRIATTLDEASAALPHTQVEHKTFAVALHTRPALEAGRPETFALAQKATSPLRELPGVHLTEGKEVLEFSVVDPATHNKGIALRELVDAVNARATLFIGDDTTDESAFAVLDDAAGDVTIRVVPPGAGIATRARHTVADPDAVATVLETLVNLRAGPAGPTGPTGPT
jgi:trehalose-phosphatase